LLILKSGRVSWRSSKNIFGQIKRLDETALLTAETDTRQVRKQTFHFFDKKRARRRAAAVLVIKGLSAAAAQSRKEGFGRSFNSRIVPGRREGE
jgi:hypothetical protein